jgi:hypothetical protein
MSRAIVNEVIVDPNGFRIREQIPHGLLRGSVPIGIGRPTPAITTTSDLWRHTTMVRTPMLLGK